jgi:hypothetical protein
VRDVSTITYWAGDQKVITAQPDKNILTINGRSLKLSPPPPPPRKTLDFDFNQGLDGWRPTRGILRAESKNGQLHLDVVAPDVYLTSPPLELNADEISAIQIRMKITGDNVRSDGLFFTTQQFPNLAGDKRVSFTVKPDGQFHQYQIKVANHPKWPGQTITSFRLDPITGSANAKIQIDHIRAVKKP